MEPVFLFVRILRAAGHVWAHVILQESLNSLAIQAFSSCSNISICYGLSCSCEEAGVYGYFYDFVSTKECHRIMTIRVVN
jgi:hypothetical protein